MGKALTIMKEANAKEHTAQNEIERLRASIYGNLPSLQKKEGSETAEQIEEPTPDPLSSSSVPAWQQLDRPWVGVEKPALVPASQVDAQATQFNTLGMPGAPSMPGVTSTPGTAPAENPTANTAVLSQMASQLYSNVL